jgi:hypothetical protein
MTPSWLDRARYPFVPRALELPEGRRSRVDQGRGPVVPMVHGPRALVAGTP